MTLEEYFVTGIKIDREKKKQMKKYNVGFWYTVYGSMNMEAKSVKEAEEKVKELLATNGLEDVDYRQNDRDYGAQDAELVDTEK